MRDRAATPLPRHGLALAVVVAAVLGGCGQDVDPAPSGSIPVGGAAGTEVAPGTVVVEVPGETPETLPGGVRIPVGAPNPVGISGHAFTPRSIEVPAGATVTWVNGDEDEHWVVSDRPELIDSGPLRTGNSFATVFDTPGTWSYHCNVHDGMSGEVVVLP